jgi:hypothetical protein
MRGVFSTPRQRNAEIISPKTCKKVHFFGVKNGKKAWFSGENEIAHQLQKGGQLWLFIAGIPLESCKMEVRTRQISTNYAMKFKPQ